MVSAKVLTHNQYRRCGLNPSKQVALAARYAAARVGGLYLLNVTSLRPT